MNNEKFFIITPVYKAEAYLHRCIDSILNQTLAGFQLVLVDDGSPDNCGAICDEYAAKDSRIHVIHQENGGVSAARNTALNYVFTHGDPAKDWISFIDSDDFVHPNYLEYLYRAAKESGTEISSCGHIRTKASEVTDSGGTFESECLSAEEYWCRKMTNPGAPWAKLYRLRCFQEIVFPVGKIFEDSFIIYRVLFAQDRITVIPNKLYGWYLNTASITMSGWRPSYFDYLEATEAQVSFFRENGYKKALKKAASDYYKGAVNNAYKIRNLSPKYDYLLEQAKAIKKQAFMICLKNAGLGSTAYCWLVPTILTKKTLRRIAKKLYLAYRNRRHG